MRKSYTLLKKRPDSYEDIRSNTLFIHGVLNLLLGVFALFVFFFVHHGIYSYLIGGLSLIILPIITVYMSYKDVKKASLFYVGMYFCAFTYLLFSYSNLNHSTPVIFIAYMQLSILAVVLLGLDYGIGIAFSGIVLHLAKKYLVEANMLQVVINEPNGYINIMIFSFLALFNIIIIGYFAVHVMRLYTRVEKDSKMIQQMNFMLFNNYSELMSSYAKIEEYSLYNSHQVRTPISRILSILELLEQEDLTSDEEREILLGMIKHSTKELDEVVKEFNKRLWLEKSAIKDLGDPKEHLYQKKNVS